MLGDLFDKLYGNSIVLANLRGQRRIPFLPEEEIDALREKRLREMVRYAAEKVASRMSYSCRMEGLSIPGRCGL